MHAYVSRENNHRLEVAKKKLNRFQDKNDKGERASLPDIEELSKILQKHLLVVGGKKRKLESDSEKHVYIINLLGKDKGCAFVDDLKRRLEFYREKRDFCHAIDQYIDTELCSNGIIGTTFFDDSEQGKVLSIISDFMLFVPKNSSPVEAACCCEPKKPCFCTRETRTMAFARMVQIEISIAELILSDAVEDVVAGLFLYKCYQGWLWTLEFSRERREKRIKTLPKLILKDKKNNGVAGEIKSDTKGMLEDIGELSVRPQDRPLDTEYNVGEIERVFVEYALGDRNVSFVTKNSFMYDVLEKWADVAPASTPSFGDFFGVFDAVLSESLNLESKPGLWPSCIPTFPEHHFWSTQFHTLEKVMKVAFDLFCMLPRKWDRPEQGMMTDLCKVIPPQELKTLSNTVYRMQSYAIEYSKRRKLNEHDRKRFVEKSKKIEKACKDISMIHDDTGDLVQNKGFDSHPMFEVIRCTGCAWGKVPLENGKCNLCDLEHCPDCWVEKKEGHVCDDDAKKFVLACKRRTNSTTQCTRCRSILERRGDGCDSFFCTVCSRRFDFVTGKDLEKRDNPEFLDWEKKNEEKHSMIHFFTPFSADAEQTDTYEDKLRGLINMLERPTLPYPGQTFELMILDTVSSLPYGYDMHARNYRRGMDSLIRIVGDSYGSLLLKNDLCRKIVIDLYQENHKWYRGFLAWKEFIDFATETFGFQEWKKLSINELSEKLGKMKQIRKKVHDLYKDPSYIIDIASRSFGVL